MIFNFISRYFMEPILDLLCISGFIYSYSVDHYNNNPHISAWLFRGWTIERRKPHFILSEVVNMPGVAEELSDIIRSAPCQSILDVIPSVEPMEDKP